jgi:hypothetical protein
MMRARGIQVALAFDDDCGPEGFRLRRPQR